MKGYLIQTDGSFYKVINTNTNEVVDSGLSFLDAETLCNKLNK